MSDLSDVVTPQKSPGGLRRVASAVWFRARVAMSYYFWPVLPLLLGAPLLVGGAQESDEAAVVSGASWCLVACVGFLACHAMYRIRVNIERHQRPFTKKDQAFCAGAGIATTCALIASIVTDFVSPESWEGKALIGPDDLMFAQTVALVMLGTLLFTLAQVHAKGVELNEELEKGV